MTGGLGMTLGRPGWGDVVLLHRADGSSGSMGMDREPRGSGWVGWVPTMPAQFCESALRRPLSSFFLSI